MKKCLNVAFKLSMLFLTSCTYSINQIHTDGTASDVLEEAQEAKPDITTSISAPLLKK